ncbi:hypothetical protein QEH57_09445 [Pelagicoccus sp. SDUM812005]|nr:hypothetical protein [Pelagicoccus sp. SDUM812005]
MLGIRGMFWGSDQMVVVKYLSLCAVLGLGGFYLGSLYVFEERSENFVVANRLESFSGNRILAPFQIDFSKGGNSEPHKLFGWSYSERQGAWTRSKKVCVGIFFAEPDWGREVTLDFDFWGVNYAEDEGRRLTVMVQVNGDEAEPWVFARGESSAKSLRAKVPETGEALMVWLFLEGIKSPAEKGSGGDRRLLGLGCSKIEVNRVSLSEETTENEV